jgi:hypothetical protein
MNRVLKEGIYIYIGPSKKLLIIAKANAKKIKPAHKKAQYGARPFGKSQRKAKLEKEERGELSHGSGSQNLPPHRHAHICPHTHTAHT